MSTTGEIRFPQLQLQLFVITVSFTAVLGELISIPAVSTVFWRTLLSAVMVFIGYAAMKNGGLMLGKRRVIQIMANGIILGLHWITFFWAVKLANVSVCLIGMATTSLFTAFTEAVINRRLPYRSEVILGVCIVPGLLVVTHSIGDHMAGLVCALCSAFLASVFPVFNRKWATQGVKPMVLTFWQMGSASVTCLVAAYLFFDQPLHENLPQGIDWLYILVMASVCTVFAFTYNIYLLKYLSAFTVNLAINFEPVYGIIMAAIFFKEYEKLSIWFFVGASVIVLVNLTHGWIGRSVSGKRGALR